MDKKRTDSSMKRHKLQWLGRTKPPMQSNPPYVSYRTLSDTKKATSNAI